MLIHHDLSRFARLREYTAGRPYKWCKVPVRYLEDIVFRRRCIFLTDSYCFLESMLSKKLKDAPFVLTPKVWSYTASVTCSNGSSFAVAVDLVYSFVGERAMTSCTPFSNGLSVTIDLMRPVNCTIALVSGSQYSASSTLTLSKARSGSANAWGNCVL